MSQRLSIVRLLIYCAGGMLFFVVIIRLPGLHRGINQVGRLVESGAGSIVSVRGALRDFFATPLRASRFAQENFELRSEVRKLIQENARFLELEEENKKLRRIIQFQEGTNYPVVVARVVGKVRENGVYFLVLNQGSQARVTRNSPVVVDGVLIGKIVKVYPSFSVASPLTAPQVKTAATLASSSSTAGIVEGAHNLAAVMRFIPKDLTVEIGKPVITSGLEELIPRGLVIGRVARIEAIEPELFQTAYLESPVRVEEVSLVSIITHPVALELESPLNE